MAWYDGDLYKVLLQMIVAVNTADLAYLAVAASVAASAEVTVVAMQAGKDHCLEVVSCLISSVSPARKDLVSKATSGIQQSVMPLCPLTRPCCRAGWFCGEVAPNRN